ncbi:MAG: hypothetical protein R3C41_11635 [Calditrichia bacterium]
MADRFLSQIPGRKSSAVLLKAFAPITPAYANNTDQPKSFVKNPFRNPLIMNAAEIFIPAMISNISVPKVYL